MPSPLRFGVRVANQRMPLDLQRALWRIVDDSGADHLWTMDHIIAFGPDPMETVFDPWTLMAAQAVETARVKLGVLVTANLYRHPALLAKMAVTIDHLSRGRLIVGLGASSAEPEFRALGMPFGTPGERIRRLDEACTVMELLWSQTRATWSGRYFTLKDAIAEPKPLQSPRPELWIGGYGAKGTLRVAARHADVWNASGGRGVETTVEATRLLDQHCHAIGRDPTSLRRSVQAAWGGNSDDHLRTAERYVRAGFTEFVIDLHGEDQRSAAEDLAATGLRRFRELA